MKKIISILSLIAFIAIVGLISCEKYSTSKIDDSVYNDALALPNPKLAFKNINIPNPTFSSEGDIVRMSIAGIMNPITNEWLKLFGTSPTTSWAQHATGRVGKVYVEVDGEPKFILISLPDPTDKNVIDYVFLVDNSGSMAEEADAVADNIVEYAKYLSAAGLDIRYGCVGYGGSSGTNGVIGALNLTDPASINAYLNRSGIYGINRTVGFSGIDSATLHLASNNYKRSPDECGTEAFRFADENFTFRNDASIFYVNFTDEPNQPGGYVELSVEYTKDPSKWIQQRGTIHTVFSADTTFVHVPYRNEKPWLMSEYTGGTTLFVNSSFTTPDGTPISLTSLPVTDAMLNTSIIRFKNTSKVPNGSHRVKITIQSADKLVQGEKILENVTFGKR